MSIRKFKPLSPDPALGKIKGDTEFARLGHLNQLIQQMRKVVTLPVPAAASTVSLTTSTLDTVIVFDGDLTDNFTIDIYPGPQALPGDRIYLFLTAGMLPLPGHIVVTYGGQIIDAFCGDNDGIFWLYSNTSICIELIYNGKNFIGIDNC